MSTTLGNILSEAQVIADLRAANRWEAIDELIGNLVATGKIKAEHRDGIIGAVRKRETSMSTGIGHGVGIPHASTDLVTEITGAFGRSTAGIDFDSMDGQAVNLVTLLLVPQKQFQQHLHTVSGIAKLFSNEAFRQALITAPDATAILQLIRNPNTP
ncbi:MAG TPA: PTS sugar transporter subunit IIA [Candidatus Acidoferrum sp.]|jgi:mannitol/fructose-specific phosphotransferase system IIA component (Ntr-type)|nr:PTS sugar transporter subunit IIA [Candidatus Acidoferrum sp.]